MTKPTVSKHWRKPAGRQRSCLNPTRTTPPRYSNTTLDNCLYAQCKGPNVTNPICLTCKNCSHKCAANCEHCVVTSSRFTLYDKLATFNFKKTCGLRDRWVITSCNESNSSLPTSQHLFWDSSYPSSHDPFHAWEKSMMSISWTSMNRNDPMTPITNHAAHTQLTAIQDTTHYAVCTAVMHKMLATIICTTWYVTLWVSECVGFNISLDT